jgi:hypothetical protein
VSTPLPKSFSVDTLTSKLDIKFSAGRLLAESVSVSAVITDGPADTDEALGASTAGAILALPLRTFPGGGASAAGAGAAAVSLLADRETVGAVLVDAAGVRVADVERLVTEDAAWVGVVTGVTEPVLGRLVVDVVETGDGDRMGALEPDAADDGTGVPRVLGVAALTPADVRIEVVDDRTAGEGLAAARVLAVGNGDALDRRLALTGPPEDMRLLVDGVGDGDALLREWLDKGVGDGDARVGVVRPLAVALIAPAFVGVLDLDVLVLRIPAPAPALAGVLEPVAADTPEDALKRGCNEPGLFLSDTYSLMVGIADALSDANLCSSRSRLSNRCLSASAFRRRCTGSSDFDGDLAALKLPTTHKSFNQPPKSDNKNDVH